MTEKFFGTLTLAIWLCTKVSPDWICAVTSRFTNLFYCERPNIAHI